MLENLPLTVTNMMDVLQGIICYIDEYIGGGIQERDRDREKGEWVGRKEDLNK